MKKIILLIIVFCLTGCNCDYDLEIYNNRVKEDLSYFNNDPLTWNREFQYGLSYKDVVEGFSKKPIPAYYDSEIYEDDSIKVEGVKYYDNKLINANDKLGQKISYHDFKLDDFSNSNLVKSCYQFANVIRNNGEIIISTSDNNICFDEYPNLDRLTINLKTNHKVKASNASVVDGYHYTWVIDRSNKENAAINITLYSNKYVFNYENEFVKKIFPILIIIGIISLIVFTIYRKVSIRNKEANKL